MLKNRINRFLKVLFPKKIYEYSYALYKKSMWWEIAVLRKFLSEQSLYDWKFARAQADDSDYLWKYMENRARVWGRPLSDAERELLETYEKRYTEIHVHFIHNDEAIGKFAINYAAWAGEAESNPKNSCRIICLGNEADGHFLVPNTFLMSKYPERFEIINKNNFPVYYALLIKKKKQVVVQSVKYYCLKAEADLIRFLEKGQSSYPIRPAIHFSEEENIKGKENLKILGVKKPYICIFARDSRYYQEMRRIKQGFDLRNSDVNAFKKTTEYFWEKGIQTVRMGNCAATEYRCDGAVDYASGNPTPFMDAVLFAGCRFFMGELSGIGGFAHLFARPWVAINVQVVTFPAFQDSASKYVLGIYLKYYDKKKKRFLRLQEIARMEIDFYRSLLKSSRSYDEYVQSHCEIVRNTPEEILDVAKEMEAIQNQTVQYTEHDEELQTRYRNLLHEIVSQYPQVTVPGIGRIGMQWLRDNEWFLE